MLIEERQDMQIWAVNASATWCRLLTRRTEEQAGEYRDGIIEFITSRGNQSLAHKVIKATLETRGYGMNLKECLQISESTYTFVLLATEPRPNLVVEKPEPQAPPTKKAVRKKQVTRKGSARKY